MTNYSYKFDGGKVEGHLDLEYIVHKSVMRRILMEYSNIFMRFSNSAAALMHYIMEYCEKRSELQQK